MTRPHASALTKTAALIPRLRTLLATGFMAEVANEGDSLALWRYLAHPLAAEEAGDRGEGKGAINNAGWILSVVVNKNWSPSDGHAKTVVLIH